MVRSGIALLLSVAVIYAPQVSSQAVVDPAYCPLTTTDTDGDGFGVANGQPCRVISSSNTFPVCSFTDLFIDPDRDGWGWENDGTCLVDNTTVENNYTITDANGNETTNTPRPPLLGSYIKSLGATQTSMQISSDGTLFQYQVLSQALSATDTTGQILWELRLFFDFVNQLVLDESEQNLYAYIGPIGRMASYSTEGSLNWKSDVLGAVEKYAVGDNAVVVGLRGETESSISSVVSLNTGDGSVRWKFDPGGEISVVNFELGRDNRVYVKYSSGPHSNITTFILAE